MKRFVCVIAIALGLMGGKEAAAQATPPSYNILVGNAPNVLTQGGSGKLPVLLSVNNIGTSYTQLAGFSLAFEFSHADASVSPTNLNNFFMQTTPNATTTLSPGVTVQRGGTDTNYDVLVKWSTSVPTSLDLTANSPVNVFDLAFNVASGTTLNSMLGNIPYVLSYVPNAYQRSGEVTVGVNQLTFTNPSALDSPVVNLTSSNSIGGGGSFSVAAVPEPASIALCGLGLSLAAAGAWRRRRGGNDVTAEASEAVEESAIETVAT